MSNEEVHYFVCNCNFSFIGFSISTVFTSQIFSLGPIITFQAERRPKYGSKDGINTHANLVSLLSK